MEHQNAVQRLLDFMNLADAVLIGSLPDSNAKPLGESLGNQIVEARVKASPAGFGNLEQLAGIKGLGKNIVQALIQRFEMQGPHPGMLKSRTQFTFAKGAPKLEEYGKEVVLEKVGGAAIDEKGNPIPTGDTATYAVYYASTVDVQQLFKYLRATKNYRSHGTAHTFAIQTRNNQFVATPVPSYSVYLREIYFASKFNLFYYVAHEHQPITFPFTNPNGKATVGIETNFYGNLGRLNFNPSQNRIEANHVSGNPNPTSGQKLDMGGIIGEPWPGAHPMFKNFTLMNFYQTYIPTGTDPREYITGNTVIDTQNGLQGSNLATDGWRRDFQMRYVEVVEDILLESVHNPSHTGNGRWYVNCKSDSTNGFAAEVKATQVLSGGAIPASARWDMFVFYGYWEERGNITCRVAFRSKQSGKFLGLKANSVGIYEDLNALHTSLNENTSFYIENGWGGTINNVNIKSSTGKYLLCWQDLVTADSVSPINHEQFQVVIP